MPHDLIPHSNSGLIALPPFITDWISGEETGIVYEERLPTGDWTPYLPTEERQKGVFFDSLACTTFSALNCVETQINWMIATGQIPADKLQELKDLGFIDDQGKFNASDRATAKLSGTTKNGNWLGAVWDSIRNHGLVPEKDWAWDRDTFIWDEFYAEIPQAVKDKGKRVLDIFSVKYEWVAFSLSGTPTAAIQKHLKHAPLQLATPVCPPWNTADVILKCDLVNPGHATMTPNSDEATGQTKVFDHYNPFHKTFAADYFIPYVMKGVVTLKTPPPAPVPFHYEFKINMVYGERNEEVRMLQKALKFLKFFPANVEETGYYGRITAESVKKFQFAYQVAPPDELNEVNGKATRVKTRRKLNELLQ